MTRHIFRSPRCCFITTRAAPLRTRIAIGSQHSVFEFFFRVRHDVGMPWCRGSPAAAADANSTRNARRNRGRVVCDSGALPGRVPTAFCERGVCAGELVILRLGGGVFTVCTFWKFGGRLLELTAVRRCEARARVMQRTRSTHTVD